MRTTEIILVIVRKFIQIFEIYILLLYIDIAMLLALTLSDVKWFIDQHINKDCQMLRLKNFDEGIVMLMIV